MLTYDMIRDQINNPDSREKQIFEELIENEFMDPEVEFDDMINIIQARLHEEDAYDDSMDGDHASALASAGFGTDEDYGGGFENI